MGLVAPSAARVHARSPSSVKDAGTPNLYRPPRRVSFHGAEHRLLFGRVEGLRFDIAELRDYLRRLLESGAKPIDYKEGDQTYFGWAVTEAEALPHRGIRHVSPSQSKSIGGLAQMRHPTEQCFGPMPSLLRTLEKFAYYPTRARVMQLAPVAEKMTFHRDEFHEGIQKWRFHVAIETNPTALFEWKIGRQIEAVHIPADGSVYAVNVNHLHRAINPSRDSSRTHFICSLLDRAERVALERGSVIEI
jgi:hypothetical protein